MAIKCPKRGAEYDVTLFTFGRSIRCDCGANVDLAVGHQQASEDGEQVSQQATTPRAVEQRREEEIKLLTAIKSALPRLERLWEQANSHWGYEDPVYRFYHGSFKVYYLQGQTAEIVTALQELAPHISRHPWFTQIVAFGEWSCRTVFNGSEPTLVTGNPSHPRSIFPRSIFLGDGLQVRRGTGRATGLLAEWMGCRAVPV